MSNEQIPERRARPGPPMVSGSTFIALASIRNTEATLRWRGAQLAIVLNLPTLITLMYRMLPGPEAAELFLLAIGCFVVAFLDREWYSTLRRDGELLDFWNRKIREHEENCSIDGGVEVFTSPDYQELSDSRRRLQRRLERIASTLIFTWSAASVILFAWTIAVLKGVL